jgi:hypothetical protein
MIKYTYVKCIFLLQFCSITLGESGVVTLGVTAGIKENQ